MNRLTQKDRIYCEFSDAIKDFVYQSDILSHLECSVAERDRDHMINLMIFDRRIASAVESMSKLLVENHE